MMNDENNMIHVTSKDSVIAPDSGSITHLEQDEKVTIKRAANHDELSMMESNWNQIKRKINAISLKRTFDVNAVLVGAAIPYAIEIISDYVNKKAPNYFPFFICVFLMVVVKLLSKCVPFLGENNSSVNVVHLDDLKHLIQQIEQNQKADKKR